MTSGKALLKDIIQVATDGADFYESAAFETRDPGLQSLFTRMGEAKRELIARLSLNLRAGGELPPDTGTLLGGLRKTYADLRALVAANETRVYVAQLEETEDRLLHHLEQAVEAASDASLRQQFRMYLPKARSCHDEMRDLKRRLAA